MACSGERWPTNSAIMPSTPFGCPRTVSSFSIGAGIGARSVFARTASSGPGCRSRNWMPDLPPPVFVLSPARAGGARMGLLLSTRANFSLAWDFQQKGAPVGDLFQFASGLYFRGKLAYARAFGRAPPGGFGALAIVPGRGLMNVDATMPVDEVM